MNISIIAIGKIKNAHYQQIEESFLKRITPRPIVYELRSYQEDTLKEEKIIEKKIQDIRQHSTHIVVLHERGKQYTSEVFSERFLEYDNLCFIIGGAKGLREDFISKISHSQLSLSKMTLPHQFARIILAEQLYRAFSIKDNHPYHRGAL